MGNFLNILKEIGKWLPFLSGAVELAKAIFIKPVQKVIQANKAKNAAEKESVKKTGKKSG